MLESQLSEAEEKLADTQQEHIFELEEKALDKFISDLESTLNNANKTVKETFEEFAERLKFLLDSSATADVAKSLGNIFELLMGSDFTADLSGMTERPYVPGESTSGVPSGETSTNTGDFYASDGDTVSDIAYGVQEISDRLDSEYVPISQTAYIERLQANVKDMSSIVKALHSETVNIDNILRKDITRYLLQMEKQLDNQSTNVNINYGSLINVNGAVDSMVVRDLERFANQVVNQTRATIINDLKSTGVYRSR